MLWTRVACNLSHKKYSMKFCWRSHCVASHRIAWKLHCSGLSFSLRIKEIITNPALQTLLLTHHYEMKCAHILLESSARHYKYTLLYSTFWPALLQSFYFVKNYARPTLTIQRHKFTYKISFLIQLLSLKFKKLISNLVKLKAEREEMNCRFDHRMSI